MNSEKQSVWTIILTVAKYAITLVLGFISGNVSASSQIFNLLNYGT